jgi:hypothetical protein
MRLNVKKATDFQEQSIPEASRLAGFVALVSALSIEAPVRRPSYVSDKHIRGSHPSKRSFVAPQEPTFVFFKIPHKLRPGTFRCPFSNTILCVRPV